MSLIPFLSYNSSLNPAEIIKSSGLGKIILRLFLIFTIEIIAIIVTIKA